MPVPHATVDRPDSLQSATDAFLQAARRLDPSERRQHIQEALQTLAYHLDVDMLVVPRGTAGYSPTRSCSSSRSAWWDTTWQTRSTSRPS